MAGTGELPPPVLEAAQRRQLGDAVDACKGLDNRIWGGCLIVLSVLAVGISVVSFTLMPVVPVVGPRILFAVGVAATILAVLGVLRAVLSMLSPRPEYFLFTGGLVERKGSRFRSVAWSDLRAITVRGSTLGSTVTRTGFDLQPVRGRRRSVLIGDQLPDQAAFTAAFERCAAEAGLPITGTVG